MRTNARTAAEKGMTAQEFQKQTYSNAIKMNLPSTTNPETEILKSQMTAIQAEMMIMRVEVGKVKTLEQKVENLETTVYHIQSSLTEIKKGQENIESGQNKTNSQLSELTAEHRRI